MVFANKPIRSAEADTGIDLSDPIKVRHAIRSGVFTEFTNTVAHGYVQGNLVILPAEFSAAFRDFCERNPRPCPLLGVSECGIPHIPSLASDMDLRTDVGGYRIFRDGIAITTTRSIEDDWRDDLVAFVLGCSFSFEQELMNEGITLRHIVEKNVSPMYVTKVDNVPAGPFGGKLVVSMRGLRPADAIRAVEITSQFPKFHGAPVHMGKPELIGIDLDRPYGGHGLTALHDDELPVFWACGATSQLAIETAKLPFAITHSKAHMVVTDLKAETFAKSFGTS
jgi:uncharacterized protein YcsI (UPF0317 family)